MTYYATNTILKSSAFCINTWTLPLPVGLHLKDLQRQVNNRFKR